MSAHADLSAIFPHIPDRILDVVADLCGGNEQLAINYLLENGPDEVAAEIAQTQAQAHNHGFFDAPLTVAEAGQLPEAELFVEPGTEADYAGMRGVTREGTADVTVAPRAEAPANPAGPGQRARGDTHTHAIAINPEILVGVAQIARNAGGGPAAIGGMGQGMPAGHDVDPEEGDVEEWDEDEGEGEYGAGMFGEGDGDDWGWTAPKPKRRKVTPTASVQGGSGSSESNPPPQAYACAFDGMVMRKQHLELLNLHPSQLDHRSIHLWRSEFAAHEWEQRREPEPLAIDPSAAAWAYFFPVADLDHVWRVVLNAHIFGHKFGSLVTINSASFDSSAIVNADGNSMAVMRAYPESKSGPPPLSELKRIGVGVLSVVAVLHSVKEVYYQPARRQAHPLKPGWDLDYDAFLMNCEYKLVAKIAEGKESLYRPNAVSFDLLRRDRSREGGNTWARVEDSEL